MPAKLAEKPGSQIEVLSHAERLPNSPSVHP